MISVNEQISSLIGQFRRQEVAKLTKAIDRKFDHDRRVRLQSKRREGTKLRGLGEQIELVQCELLIDEGVVGCLDFCPGVYGCDLTFVVRQLKVDLAELTMHCKLRLGVGGLDVESLIDLPHVLDELRKPRSAEDDLGSVLELWDLHGLVLEVE